MPESASDRAADPDYVVLGEGLSSSEDEEEKEEQLKGKKLAKMEKKIREEDARSVIPWLSHKGTFNKVQYSVYKTIDSISDINFHVNFKAVHCVWF